MRPVGWEQRLDAYLAARREMAFAWGTHDCCRFACLGLAAQGLHVTVSIGLSSFADNKDNAEILVGNAARNLYQAKHEGRNRVVGETAPAGNADIAAIASKAS